MVPAPNSPPDRPIAGIMFNLLGLSVFPFQDVIMKLLSDRYAVWQFGVVRAVVAVTAFALVLVVMRQVHQFRARRPGLILLRGVLTFVGYTCYYLAIASLPLADAVAVVFSAPLIVTALSVPLLGERVGLQRGGAIVVGFGGILLIVQPGLQTFQPALLLAVATAIVYALSMITTRKIGHSDSAVTIAMYGLLVFGLASGLGSALLHIIGPEPSADPSLAFLTRPWAAPTSLHLGLMVATGFITAVGHFCSAQAYRIAPPSLVSAFEYSYFVWAVGLGFWFWGDVPSRATMAGVTVIIGTGLYVVRREAQLRRARAP